MIMTNPPNLIRQTAYIVFACVVSGVPMFACDKEQEDDQKDPDITARDLRSSSPCGPDLPLRAAVTEEAANRVARQFAAAGFDLQYGLWGNSRYSSRARTVSSVIPVQDMTGTNAYYIMNYREGGFVIVAADRRVQPILAYSDTHPFVPDAVDAGLDEWLYATMLVVAETRRSKEPATHDIAVQWNSLLGESEDECLSPRKKALPLPGPDQCHDTSTSIGPLLTTTWGQGCGYNGTTPAAVNMGCGGLPCGHAFTGCVATAMAQIMRYHKFPAAYNWADMPNASGTATTSQLMTAVGKAVGMDYECDGSGADTKAEVASSFVNDFGYKSATYLDYAGTANYSAVQSNLSLGRPVIFKGGENTGWWIFGQYSNGHAWVADGYISSFFCETGTGHLMFHMNWGWSGDNNGWYAFNNFNPGSYTFNYKSGVVLNIVP
jgi:hypothetical protein